MCFGTLCLSTVAIASVVAFIYLHYKKNHSFWKSKGVNGPPPLPLLGNVLDFSRSDFGRFFIRNAQKYGRVYGYYEGSRHVLSVAEPELLKQVFIKDFHIFGNRRDFSGIDELLEKTLAAANGKKWKKLRSIVSPTFSTGKIKRMKPQIDRCARDATDFLEELAEKKEEIHLSKFWRGFTLQVIACCCFASSINAHKDPNNVFLKKLSSLTTGSTLFMFLFLTLPLSILNRLPIKLFPQDTMKFIKDISLHLMKQRKEEGSNHNDFLQLLIEAEKENKDKDVEPLTDDEVAAQCFLFFIAGVETTAAFLHWCCYALAMNPEVQEKLHNELKNHFSNIDEADYDTVNKLPYLDAFLSETFRMYPSNVNTERVTTEEVEIGGIKIPAKSIVNIPIYAIHHDPEFYEEPETFNPERFTNENKEKLNSYTHLPFGLGPRNCVAMRFAIMETKFALIHTIFKFKLLKSNKTPTKPKFKKFTSGLIPTTDVFVNVEKR